MVPALLQTGQEGCWIKDGVKPNATQNTCVVQSSRMHRGSTHPGIRRVNHPTHGHSLTLRHPALLETRERGGNDGMRTKCEGRPVQGLAASFIQLQPAHQCGGKYCVCEK